MRLFVAIDLDDAAREAVAAEQQRLMEPMAGAGRSSLRWVRPEQMHLTLVFLGEESDARAAAVADAMQDGFEVAPFPIAFAGLGVFPPRGAPSVLWLGVTDGSREAIALQGRVATRLQPIGFTPDGRPYHPHLTLGRWRTSKRVDRQRAFDADRGAEIARLTVAAVTLYQSHVSSAGPKYTALARAPLLAVAAGL